MTIEVTEAVHVTVTEATIAKLDLKPDDVIVIKITDPKYNPSADAVEFMRKRTRELVGDHEVLILGHGVDLEVVAPTDSQFPRPQMEQKQ